MSKRVFDQTLKGLEPGCKLTVWKWYIQMSKIIFKNSILFTDKTLNSVVYLTLQWALCCVSIVIVN